LAKYNAFVSTAIMVDKMLIGLCQTINSGVHDLIVIADIVSLVLNKNLEERIKKDVNDGTLHSTSFNLGIPIGFCIIIFFKNRGPFCLIFANGISAEKVVFQQFRGCQINAKRIDCVKNLLFVLVCIQINSHELGIHHDHHNVKLILINMVNKVIIRFNNSGLRRRVIYFICGCRSHNSFESFNIISPVAQSN